MSIYTEIAIGAAFVLLAAWFFYRGKVSAGIVSVGGLVAYLVASLTKERSRELTPMQHLDAIKKEIDEAKEEGDEAVLSTIPKTDHTKTRRERWENL